MPALLERAVTKIKAKGYSKQSAYAIATARLQKAGDLKPGTTVATSKGIMRGKKTPAQLQAMDRATKKKKRKPK